MANFFCLVGFLVALGIVAWQGLLWYKEDKQRRQEEELAQKRKRDRVKTWGSYGGFWDK